MRIMVDLADVKIYQFDGTICCSQNIAQFDISVQYSIVMAMLNAQ
jgi:hypothetical protein